MELDYGYYYKADRYEMFNHIDAIVLHHNESAIVKVHISNKFLKIKSGEEITVHNKPTSETTAILDPMQNSSVLLPGIQQMELDDNQYVDESGLKIIPNTTLYWYKIQACQPNPTPNPNSTKSASKIMNVLVEGVIRTYASLNKVKIRNEADLVQFANQKNQYLLRILYTKFVLQDFHAFTKKYLKFNNVIIFNRFGNVYYKHLPKESKLCSYFYYDNIKREVKYIHYLPAFFKAKNAQKQKFCLKCLQWRSDNHKCVIKNVKSQSTETMKKSHKPQQLMDIVVYADFESITTNPHQLSGYSFLAIDNNQEIIDYGTYHKLQQPDLIKSFMESMFVISKNYQDITCKPTKNCTICNNEVKEDVVLGKNFINGKSGSHHQKCWEKPENALHVFFHNFRGYDSHLLIGDLISDYNIKYLNGKTFEKMDVIQLEKSSHERVVFKDSLNFLSASLDACVKSCNEFKFSSTQEKGAFPYEWFDSFSKLNDTQLPSDLDSWKNNLNNKSVPREEYEKALKVWQQQEFENFGDYHNYYMSLDTALLADVFESFRRAVFDEYKVDCITFQGAPSLTWYLATVNEDDFKIITDKDVYIDFTQNIRGGVSQAMVRYAIADPSKESIVFLDVNSLYSYCMTFPLPTKFIRKIEGPEIDKVLSNDFDPFDDEQQCCYVFCVDIEYPKHLHDRDWAFPLCPHKHDARLCTTFLKKEKILLHQKTLEFYTRQGLEVTNIHYIYEFEQKKLLNNYVSENIRKRRETNSPVYKNLYKLLNNSLYGKTCENVFKYHSFKQETNVQQANGKKNPYLATCKDFIFYGNNVLVEKDLVDVTLTKPIQLGFTILELAKLQIYQFIAALQNQFGDTVTPMYTDTDSLMLHCKFPNGYETLYKNKQLRQFLDFSTFDYGNKDSAKQSGLWSPELDGDEIIEYVGLRAKTYAYKTLKGKQVMKNKGVPSNALSKESDNPIDFDDYKRILNEGDVMKASFYKIKSKHHELTTEQMDKIALNSMDEKRIILKPLHISVPFGYEGQKFKEFF